MGIPQGWDGVRRIAPRETASREFTEETSLVDWAFREGFERSLSYTYLRRGRKVLKTVTYYIVEVKDEPPWPARRARRGRLPATGFIGEHSNRSLGCSTTPRSGRSSPRRTPGSRMKMTTQPDAHRVFLVLDGPDGGGKTTQAARLADWLASRASRWSPAATPGDRRWAIGCGDPARSLERRVRSLRAEMLLYMASRASLSTK